jgi:glycine cleavage system aminomethyltransferase T
MEAALDHHLCSTHFMQVTNLLQDVINSEGEGFRVVLLPVVRAEVTARRTDIGKVNISIYHETRVAGSAAQQFFLYPVSVFTQGVNVTFEKGTGLFPGNSLFTDGFH